MTVEIPTTKHADDALIPELAEYSREFQKARTDIDELLDGVTEDQFNWRPGEKEWSMAECLDHLIVVGTKMIEPIDQGIAKAKEKGWESNGPFKYGALGNWFVRVVGDTGDPPKRKFKAPALYTPTSKHSLGRIRDGFIGLQDQYVERVNHANGLDLARVKVPSPAMKLVRLSLGQWFAMLAGHQKRHFTQARRVRHMREQPPAS